MAITIYVGFWIPKREEGSENWTSTMLLWLLFQDVDRELQNLLRPWAGRDPRDPRRPHWVVTPAALWDILWVSGHSSVEGLHLQGEVRVVWQLLDRTWSCTWQEMAGRENPLRGFCLWCPKGLFHWNQHHQCDWGSREGGAPGRADAVTGDCPMCQGEKAQVSGPFKPPERVLPPLAQDHG